MKMPIKLIFASLWASLLLAGCSESEQSTDGTDFAYIEANFQDPPSEFRPAPFWIWHEKVTRDKIKEQLTDFKDKGIGGVFVHPRYGLVTEYLSDEWFSLFGYTLDVAEELGMKVWIYDENSFPSGFAGGLVPAEMPESYNQGQGLVLQEQTTFSPDSNARYLHYLKADGNGDFTRISNPENERGNKGQYFLFELVNYEQRKWYAGYSYVDLIHPGVTEKFIETTMGGYEQFSDHFGSLIPGVFTDEPNIAPPGGDKTIRWTPDLYERFEERWGYRLEDNLMSLYRETGKWKKVRHNYYQLLLQLFVDRWAKPWYEYTEKNDLAWTGHYWEHGWPDPNHGGDNMAMYAWHQQPGIDLLFNTIDQDENPTQFGNPRLVKELKSVASQMGRERTLSETYGASGWELTMEDQKRLGDWAYALGLNFLNPHLSYMTLLGDRKHDFPQSFSYHSPFWAFYDIKTDYFARLSLVLSSATQHNDILVIEPTSSTWMYSSFPEPNDYLDSIGGSFHKLLDEMEAYQIEYDLGSENIIKDQGFVNNGQFGINQREYKLVVLPEGMKNLDMPTFNLLNQYLEQGGKVISLKHYPELIDGVQNNELDKTIEKYEEQWQVADYFDDLEVKSYFVNDEIAFQTEDKKARKLYHYRGRLNDGQIVFLVNTDKSENARGSFTIDGQSVAQLDAETGTIMNYPSRSSNNQLEIDFEIKPANSLLLYISNDKQIFPENRDTRIATPTELTAPLTDVSPTSPNVLVLDYCHLTIGEGKKLPLEYFYKAGNMVWNHYGFDDNPWASSSQFKTELAERDTFSVNTGYQLSFPFEVADNAKTSGIKAVVERPGLFEVSINGNKVSPVEGEWYLEKDFGVFDVGRQIIHGQNELSVTVNPMSMFAEAAPVFLTGDFSLQSKEKGWKITSPDTLTTGSWKKQGYPYYSDGMTYRKQVDIETIPNQVLVKLNNWEGTVAEVRVNDTLAGVIGWQPFETDVTDFLKEGKNEVEVIVYGSLKNLLGPHHFVKREGIVTPWSFKFAPEEQPAGTDYHLLDYGLMEDFSIMVSNQ